MKCRDLILDGFWHTGNCVTLVKTDHFLNLRKFCCIPSQSVSHPLPHSNHYSDFYHYKSPSRTSCKWITNELSWYFWQYMCGYVLSFVLFCWVVWLYFQQCLTIALWKVLKSGSVSPPTLFYFFIVVLSILGSSLFI